MQQRYSIIFLLIAYLNWTNGFLIQIYDTLKTESLLSDCEYNIIVGKEDFNNVETHIEDYKYIKQISPNNKWYYETEYCISNQMQKCNKG